MLSRLFDEIGSRPLGLSRIIVGSAALLRLLVAVPQLVTLAEPDTLNIPYFDWTPAPTPVLAISIAIVWGLSAVLFILGWKVAVTGTTLFLALVATLAVDQQTYSNHLYLMSWLVLLLTLARAGSGLNLRRTDRPVIRWPVLLLMVQLSIVYGFSALTKLNATFLSGSVLTGYLGAGPVPFPEALKTPQLMASMAAAAVFVELFVAIFIWRERFRPAAFVLGFGLHLSIVAFMADTIQLVVFALEMLALYPLFLPQTRLTASLDQSTRDAGLVRRLNRLDVLQAVEAVPSTDQTALSAAVGDEVSTGFAAVERILERVVPTLWVAPILRLPGIRGIGERWYQRSRTVDQPVGG